MSVVPGVLRTQFGKRQGDALCTTSIHILSPSRRIAWLYRSSAGRHSPVLVHAARQSVSRHGSDVLWSHRCSLGMVIVRLLQTTSLFATAAEFGSWQ
jgi:hypothetical protein